jgi:predicted CoA-binding protein
LAILTKPIELRRALEQAKIIAVLGAHPDLQRAAGYVPDYLAKVGYRILPVNPVYAGHTLFGETVVASLAELRGRVDILDVFRRSEAIAGHVDEVLAMRPRPRVVWLQLGVRDDAAAAAWSAAGLHVVQDRCTLAEHRALGLGAA